MKLAFVTHKEMLEQRGITAASPVSGSMLPTVRPNRDVAVFEPVKRDLRKYDVVLYERGGQNIMHRIIGVKEADASGQAVYLIRGDSGGAIEEVPAERIIGIMTGLYRDTRFIDCGSRRSGLYARFIVCVCPLLRLMYCARRHFSRSGG